VDLDDWKEGVEEYRELDVADVQRAFALPTPHLPFFNKKQDLAAVHAPWSPEGREALKAPEATELRPFWHQWIGILKLVDNMMHGRSTLIMDQVGVGKTMQAVGLIAMYEWLRRYHAQHHRYPDHFG
ncbi:hypothetical protein BV20DRAFT_916401, partial [Pilatotrama ljubarskyi]